MTHTKKQSGQFTYDRREFLKSLGAVWVGLAFGSGIVTSCSPKSEKAETFIAKAASYQSDIASVIRSGFRELGINGTEIRGKRILLKPNMVETPRGAIHIVTHPSVVRAAAEAFLSLGADQIIVGEGPGHCRDTETILEDAGYDYIFRDKKLKFIDLNHDDWLTVPNAGRATNMESFVLPKTVKNVDWIVSMPKLKTHHWAGVTLSMKNLFGTLPGIFYGWPKNVLHVAGINKCIFDITSTLRPHFAIVDGIVGMEGDGPIMGDAKNVGLIIMGRNLPATDATCARLMGIDPYKVKHLTNANGKLGPIKESLIVQHGEDWTAVRTDFSLLEHIHAHRGIKMS